MIKHFAVFPKEARQYNPPAVKNTDFSQVNTVDENGRNHSYDDKPALIINLNSKFSPEEFYWYSHGELYRAENKAHGIRASSTTYETLNEKEKLHSYNGSPAYIDYDKNADNLWIQWYENGKLHRADDLPALMVIENGKISEEIFYKNGVPHRGNGLPAQIEQDFTAWIVEGGVHNVKQVAVKEYDHGNGRTHIYKKWGLYGVLIPENVFNSTLAYHGKRQVPLWVAFLRVLNIVTETDIDSFMDMNDTWDAQVPTDWLLRAWGITDEKFKKKINQLFGELNERNEVIDYQTYSLNLFLNIVKSDEAYAASLKPLGQNSDD